VLSADKNAGSRKPKNPLAALQQVSKKANAPQSMAHARQLNREIGDRRGPRLNLITRGKRQAASRFRGGRLDEDRKAQRCAVRRRLGATVVESAVTCAMVNPNAKAGGALLGRRINAAAGTPKGQGMGMLPESRQSRFTLDREGARGGGGMVRKAKV